MAFLKVTVKPTLSLGFLVLFMHLPSFAKAESYNQLDANVRQLQNRVEEKQKKIKELGEQKNATKDKAAQKAILDEMVVEARELRENVVKFQKEKKRLKYQHPERGDETDRKYKRFEVQVLEDLSSFSNLDLRLKGALGRVEKSYGKPPEVVEKETAKRVEKSQETGQLQSKEAPTNEALQTRPKLSY
jgi:outer membrane murein-binding lipoprotein Lpp